MTASLPPVRSLQQAGDIAQRLDSTQHVFARIKHVRIDILKRINVKKIWMSFQAGACVCLAFSGDRFETKSQLRNFEFLL